MSENATQALGGIKVLDLSRVLAGPWCTQILADFGADVLKIEEPKKGDDTRGWGPPFLSVSADGEPAGDSAYFASCNRNKRSVAIDFSKPDGAEIVRRLAAEADVFVENFKAGGLRKYGLDYESIAAINPRIVYTSITGFGQQSVYSSRPGYDYVAQAMSGLMSVTGDADRPPLKVGVPISDLSTGLYAALSTLIALRHAESTGQGQHVDCSLLDSQISMLGNLALTYLVGGSAPKRYGNSHPTVVPSGVFPTADGEAVIAPGNDRQFTAMCAALGAPEMATDPRFVRNRDRAINREALEAEISALSIKFGSSELVERLVAASVPASRVNSIEDIFNDPFVQDRGTVHYFEEDGVRVPSVAYPGRLSETPARFDRSPPRLGMHTVNALKDWLAISEDELSALAKADILRDTASDQSRSDNVSEIHG